MRGDFSRIRPGQGQGYTSVLEQQGRVRLDADANEQRFLDERLRQTALTDIIGQFGGPAGEDAGFAITLAGSQLFIGPGRYYVAGLLAENTAGQPVPYDDQPSPLPPYADDAATLLGLVSSQQKYLQVVLQVWQRLVTALDDPGLRDPALGQADTTARLQTRWRVIARPADLPAPGSGGPSCALLYASPATDDPGPGGTLSVTADGTGTGYGSGPACGYQGMENQLYRIEIHTGGDDGHATFKWSRENGSVVAAVSSVTTAPDGGSTVQVSSLGPDVNLGFQAGQWVELTDDGTEFADPPGAPGTLCQVQSTDQDALTMTFASPAGVDPGRQARARRWDQTGPAAGPSGIPLVTGTQVTGGGWQFELENGILVTFGTGTYRPGDYWTFAARTATGTVEWPPAGSDGSLAQRPCPLQVYEAPLACLYWKTGDAGTTPTAPAPPAAPPGQPPPVPPTLAPSTLAPVTLKPGQRALRPATPAGSAHADVVAPDLDGVYLEDCRRSFAPLTAPAGAASPGTSSAIRVQSKNWTTGALMTLDELVANGLSVTLDQPVTSPVNGGNFIVTLEYYDIFSSISPNYNNNAWVGTRLVKVLDMPVTVSGSTLTWSLPADHAQTFIQPLLTTSAEERLWGRLRIRLVGSAFAAAGGVYLDGQGSGQAPSDFESWIDVPPAQAIQRIDVTPSEFYVISSNGQFLPIPVPNGSAEGVFCNVALVYPALSETQVELVLTEGEGPGSAPQAPVGLTLQDTLTVHEDDLGDSAEITITGRPAAADSYYIFNVAATLRTPSGWESAAQVDFKVDGSPPAAQAAADRPAAQDEPPRQPDEPADPLGEPDEPPYGVAPPTVIFRAFELEPPPPGAGPEELEAPDEEP